MCSRGRSRSVSAVGARTGEWSLMGSTLRSELIQIHKQSCYLIGRDRIVSLARTSPFHHHRSSSCQVSDIPVAHPSASKQHAVIQYRQMTERNEFGDTKTMIKWVLTLLNG
jgi:smad nuclear-interacting protein 1